MKKLLSLVLALCMLISAVPMNLALAEEAEAPVETVEEAAAAAEKAEEPAAPAPAEKKAEPEKKQEAPAAKAEPVKEEAKAEEPAKEEAKAEEPAKEEAKAEEPAKEEAKAEEPAKEEAKAEEPAKEEAKAEEPAKEAPVAEEPAKEAPAAEPEKQEEPAEETPELIANGDPEEEPEGAEEDLIEKAKPATPTGLKVVSGTYDSVKLSWNAVSGAHYTLYSNDGTGYKEAATDIDTLTYELKNLTCGTEYSFQVQAWVGTAASDRSARVTYTPKPAAPASLTLKQDPSTTITLTWPQVDGANGYYIYKSVEGAEFATLGQNSSKTNVTYIDKGVIMGQTVEYRVTAYRNVGDGTVEGDYAEAYIDLKPLAPKNVQVTGSSSSTATVKWDALTGAESYIVKRTTTDGGEGLPVGTTTATYFEDSGLAPGTKYYYTVVAVINGTEGNESAVFEYTHKVAAVTGLTVTAQTADSISLSWDQDTGATRYKLEYKSANGSTAPTSWVEVGSSADPNANDKITDNVKAFKVKDLDSSTVYLFRISAVVVVSGSDVTGDASPEVVGATNPTPITDLEIDSFDYNFIQLKWTEDSSFSGTVEIYRQDGTAPAKKIGEVAAGVLLYKDETVACGTTYTYTLKTLVKITSPKTMELRSEASNAVSEKPRNIATAVVIASPLNATSVEVTWVKVTGAQGYRIRYRLVGDDSFGGAQYISGEATEKGTVKDLIPGALYEFEVAAFRTVGGSRVVGLTEISNQTRPVPEKPKTITVTVASSTSLKVTWSKTENTTGYYVYMQEEDGVEKGTFTSPIQKITVSTNSYTATELKTGRIYKFYVCGYVLDPDGLERAGVASDTAEGKPIPAAPTNFAGSSVDSHTIHLTWNKVDLGTVANSGYEVMYSADGLTYTSLIVITDQTVTEYTHNIPTKACDVRYYKLHSVIPCEGKNVCSEDVTLQITPVPRKGTNLELTSDKTTEIVLTFDGEKTATYYVERREGSGAWTQLTGSPTWDTVEENWVFTDSTVKKGVNYTYRVKPMVTVGSNKYYGEYSDTVSGRSRPGVPTAFDGTCLNALTIRVDWHAGVTDANGYQVQRSDSATDGYVTLGTSAKTYYDDKTAVTGKTYFYRVRAFYTYGSDSKRYGDWKYLDAPQDTTGVQCVPTPPEDFEVKSQTYNSVTLKWTKTVGTNCHYRIVYDNMTDSIPDLVATDSLALSKTSYTVKNLEVGKQYTFHIFTVCKLDDGTEMVSVPADVGPVTIVPEQVTTLKVTSEPPADATPGALYNKLTWSDVNGATGYNIYRRKQSDATATKITSTPVTSSPYYDTNTSFKVGEIYYYSIKAVGNGGTEGEVSEEVKVTILPLPTSGLVVESAGPTSVTATWDDMSATKYYLYRSTKAGKLGTLVKTVTGLTHTFTGLTCGKAYYFTVKAVIVDSGNTYVGKASTQVKCIPLPLAPVQGTPSAYTCLKAKLNWSTVPGASGYELAYRIASTSTWTKGGSAGKSKTSGKVTVELTDRKYEFAVRAYTTVDGVKYYGPYSDPSVQLELKPMDVLNLTASTTSTAKVTLKWKKRGGVTGYNIYSCATYDGVYKKIGSTDELTYEVKGLTPGELTYFKVTCYVTQGGTNIESDLATATYQDGYIKLKKPVVSLKTNGNTLCRIGWKKISGAGGYEIRAKKGSGSKLTIDTVTDPALVQYVHEATNTVMPYDKSEKITYQVRAFVVQSNGNTVYSSWSTEVVKPKK